MNLFSILIQQAAMGSVKSHQLLSTLKNGQQYEAGSRTAMFRKDRPGHFTVTLGGPDGEVEEVASSPVEAKLTVLDWLIDGMRADGIAPAPAKKSPAKK